MSLRQIRLADIAPRPWRNGGGRTRELLAWPEGPDRLMRISVADIDADGPFSVFAGVLRWFAVLEGAGLVLSFADGERGLTPDSDPLRFDGALAPGCRLIDGHTRDLNLMLRAGVRGALERAQDGVTWSAAWRWRACFTTGPAQWQGEHGDSVAIAARTLAYAFPAGPCRLVAADATAPMFWIGADLDGEASP